TSVSSSVCFYSAVFFSFIHTLFLDTTAPRRHFALSLPDALPILLQLFRIFVTFATLERTVDRLIELLERTTIGDAMCFQAVVVLEVFHTLFHETTEERRHFDITEAEFV